MDRKRKMIGTAALVAFLGACGGGGGAKAVAEHITDAMFNALSARVPANESSIVTLQTASNLLDVNGTVVGPIVGRGNGGTASVNVTVSGTQYVASLGPDGTWRPKVYYNNEPTCSIANGMYVDQREVEAGFDYVWSPGDFITSNSGWYNLETIDANFVPGWIKDGFGSCTGIQNPRLKFYSANFIGASDVYLAPFNVQ